MEINLTIDTRDWERSSDENWFSPSPTSLKMLKNLNHDYIVSDVSFSNYTLRSKISITQDDDGVGVVFDYFDSNNYKYIMYQGGGLTNGWGGDFGTNSTGRVNAIALFQVENGITKRLETNELAPYWTKNTPFEIKLENIFDDVFFYVNDIEFLRYKKQDSVSGKIGFVTFSQIADFEDITITKAITNRAKAKYKLYAIGQDEIETSITVAIRKTSEIETSITPQIHSNSDKNTELDIMYRGNSDIYTEIQPVGYNNLPTEIEVPPHNRMSAMFEVQQPPIVTTTFNPTQDSFTREHVDYQTINYGSNSTMVVGRSDDDIWRSFVQFDTVSVNSSYVLTESYLRLYYKGVVPEDIKLEILNADKRWSEYSITHLNKPNPIKLISNQFTVNEAYGYVEFDVLSIVKDWIALKTDNNGFVIRVANETQVGQVSFHTRESVRPPELVVKYYDSRIFSHGRSQFLTEIFAIYRGNSDKVTEVEVTSAFKDSLVDTYLYVHRVEVPLDSDILTEITVNKKHIPIEITSAIPKIDDIKTDISIRVPKEIRMPTEVSISRPEVLVEIKCVISDKSEIETVIASTRPETLVEITASKRENSDVLLEIEIEKKPMSNKLAEITVTKPNISTEISSRVKRYQDLYTSVDSSRPFVEVEIFSKYRSEILIEIEPNIKSDVSTEIVATKPYIETSLTVKQYGNNIQDTEIFVSYLSEKDTEIDIKKVSQVETEIDIKLISQIPTEIYVNRKEVLTTVIVPTWVDYWQPVEIQPRVLKVSNISTTISVSGFVGGAYAFII